MRSSASRGPSFSEDREVPFVEAPLLRIPGIRAPDLKTELDDQDIDAGGAGSQGKRSDAVLILNSHLYPPARTTTRRVWGVGASRLEDSLDSAGGQHLVQRLARHHGGKGLIDHGMEGDVHGVVVVLELACDVTSIADIVTSDLEPRRDDRPWVNLSRQLPSASGLEASRETDGAQEHRQYRSESQARGHSSSRFRFVGQG